MASLSRTLVVSILLPSVLLVAGCGEGSGMSKGEYIDRSNEVQQSVSDTINGLELGAGTEPAKAAANIRTARTAIDDATAELEQLEPPSDWQDEHDTLIASLKESSAALEAMATAATKRDQAALNGALTRLQQAGAQQQSAIDSMNASR